MLWIQRGVLTSGDWAFEGSRWVACISLCALIWKSYTKDGATTRSNRKNNVITNMQIFGHWGDYLLLMSMQYNPISDGFHSEAHTIKIKI